LISSGWVGDGFVRLFYGFTIAEDLPVFNLDQITGDAETAFDEVSIWGIGGSSVNGGFEDHDIAEFRVGCSVNKFVSDDVVVGAQGVHHGGAGNVKRLDAEWSDEHKHYDCGIDQGVGEVIDDAGKIVDSGAKVDWCVFEIGVEDEPDGSEDGGENNDLADRRSRKPINQKDKVIGLALGQQESSPGKH
jgi:hypothetical protein